MTYCVKLRTMLFAAIAMLMSACHDVPVVEVSTDRPDSLSERLLNANKYIAGSEEKQIDSYISRRGWQMERLGGGARVMETVAGEGRVEADDTVMFDYSLEAIDGQVIYRQVSDTVIAGKMQPTRGLDAALLTLGRGSRATVILPSEQGYGVMGDGDRVGHRMILIYKIEVKDIRHLKL